MSYNSYAKNSTFPPPTGGGGVAAPDFTAKESETFTISNGASVDVSLADLLTEAPPDGLLWLLADGKYQIGPTDAASATLTYLCDEDVGNTSVEILGWRNSDDIGRHTFCDIEIVTGNCP